MQNSWLEEERRGRKGEEEKYTNFIVFLECATEKLQVGSIRMSVEACLERCNCDN